MIRRRFVLLAFLTAASPAAAAQAPASSGADRVITGVVVDPMGGAIDGARVTLATPSGRRMTQTTADGVFTFDRVDADRATLTITYDLFAPRTIEITSLDRQIRVVMDPLGITETVRVQGDALERRTATATKTSTPLRDVPQAISTVDRDLITEQSMRGMADVVNYVPGVGMAQGEGHRDAPIFRGNTSTSDFYVDGLRDDTQYLRDLYNVERVEVLKGPNGTMFGRGGVGGVINRVTRQADRSAPREVSLNLGSWNQRRLSGDLGQPLTATTSARVTGVFENSGSYREGAYVERMGINPTVATSLGGQTRLTTGYEFFRDERTVDRGVPSYRGRPLEIDPATFFGNVDNNNSSITVNAFSALLETRLAGRIILRNNTRLADYDKSYENLVPGAVNAAATTVALTGYRSTTARQNLFNQTDVILSQQTGPVAHTILAGAELARQTTINRRLTAYFPSISPATTTLTLALDNPHTTLPVEFRPSATDADNRGVATVAAVYAQDQIALSRQVQVIAGLRFDHFAVDLTDHRTSAVLTSRDGLLSPRAAVVYKPIVPLSVYASYTRTYLPRAGEQLASLSLTNQALEPEHFRNYEVGAKWDVTSRLAFTTAAYRLLRGNVVVRDAVDPTLSHLVDGERSSGLEVELSGDLTTRWRVQGGYAYQDGEITHSVSATVPAGARLAQVPRHSFSVWNRYDLTERVGVGLGVISMSDRFVATDNTVVLPAFTRVDGALFYQITPRIRAHVNVENALDTRYYWAAHSNNNIAPGSPRAVRFAVTTQF
jgi:catecholate siderophore receptor